MKTLKSVLSQQLVLVWGEKSPYFRDLQQLLQDMGAALEVVTSRSLHKNTRKMLKEFSFVFVKFLNETQNYDKAKELRDMGYEGNVFLLNPCGATNNRAQHMARKLKLQVITSPEVTEELLFHLMRIEIEKSGHTHENLLN